MKLCDLRLRIKEALGEIKKGKRDYTRLGVSSEYSLDPEELIAIDNMTTSERNKFLRKKLRASRKKRGICIDCGKELTKSTSYPSVNHPSGQIRLSIRCPQCLDRMKKIGKQLYQQRTAPLDYVIQEKTTITRSELKEVIKHTLRSILMEMNRPHRVLSMLEEGPIPYEDLRSAWRDDQAGEYVQINPDDSVWYVAHGRPREQLAPRGTPNPFPIIAAWMNKGGVVLDIWQVNDHGNVELFSRSGKPLGGLAETIMEMTTTSAVDPINLPGNVRGGWVSGRGGSSRGLAGSKSLGYELTPIGRKDMARKQDPVYE